MLVLLEGVLTSFAVTNLYLSMTVGVGQEIRSGMFSFLLNHFVEVLPSIAFSGPSPELSPPGFVAVHPMAETGWPAF